LLRHGGDTALGGIRQDEVEGVVSGPYRDAALTRATKQLDALQRFADGTKTAIQSNNLALARYIADDARSTLLEVVALLGTFTECVVCGTEFLSSRSDALTCSDRCRVAKHRRAS